ncbi:hypothetical protein [Enterococcus hirae]|uniref:hypothetical protein n=1 Tax=Enterococcus hirae TaxID=1354 RepID=UPI00136F1A33|nr:hypothetical protein [Enterococcus hirae]NAE18064.1 hypothetical protein [Enterococcus hirae]
MAEPLLTTVRFDLTGADEQPLTRGGLDWVPTRGPGGDSRLTGGGRVVFPEPFSVALGEVIPQRAITSTDDGRFTGAWCWQVTERSIRGGRTRYVLVPRSDAPLHYAELPDVDPSTLAPSKPAPSWYEAFARDVARRLVELQAAHTTGTPITDPITDADDYVDGFLNGTLGATL